MSPSDPGASVPAETPAPPAAADTGPRVINSVAYEQGRRVAEVPLPDISEALKDPSRWLWIGLFEPDAPLLEAVREEFGLHELAIEDAQKAHQRPKIEPYEDSLFVVLRTASLAPPGGATRLEFGETHVFLGRNYVVTVRHGSMRPHTGLRARCEAAPERLAMGPGFVLYALMDFVVDQYFPILEALEEDFDSIERRVFEETPSRRTTEEIYRLKRDLISLKHAVFPLVEVCGRLSRFDLQLIPDEINPYFRDVQDHVLRLNEMIDNARELLGSALEANLALITEQNSVHTKRLAAWAAIIAVPTMVAGIYGMNFRHMPELEWRWGYPLAVGIMLAACGALFVTFKKTDWL